VKRVPGDLDLCELLVGDGDASLVFALVEPRVDRQPGGCGGAGDEIDDDLVTDQWLAAPVGRDEAEQPVLDFVPLRGAGWEMADDDLKSGLVREPLELEFPQTGAGAVGSAAVGGDRQRPRLGVAGLAEMLAPVEDRIDGERGGVA
jgi:hypothetical protein